MNSTEKEKDIKRYYQSIKKALVCKPKAKKEILEQLQNSVEEYMESHPDCTVSDIEANFGSSQSIAEEYAEADGINYERRVKFNKTVKISVVIISVLIIVFAVITRLAIIANKDKPDIERFSRKYYDTIK